jgi:hypothetical protein
MQTLARDIIKSSGSSWRAGPASTGYLAKPRKGLPRFKPAGDDLRVGVSGLNSRPARQRPDGTGRRCELTKNPLQWFSTRTSRQSEAIPGSSQVPNSAGGYAWPVDDWTRLRRFLILGVDGDTY